MRVALGIEYDGSCYAGWQYQPHAPSVQERVESALAIVANEPVRVACAGRTDAGVHACGQVVHFDTSAERRERSWVLGANTHLPASINVNWARVVDDEFHARFSAVARSYRYLILNRWVRSAIHSGRATWVHQPLDATAMHRAAQHLLGEHDFSSYRALACQANSPIRIIERIAVQRDSEWVALEVTANAFLHHMVRNIAGVLIAIGKGERETAWAREVLEHRSRAMGGATAPPDGLFFIGPRYPERFGIPQRQIWPVTEAD